MKLIEKSENNSVEENEKYLINSTWSIYNKNDSGKIDYHTNSYDYKYAYKNWVQSLEMPLLEYGASILLINDADQIFYNSYKLPCIATIVDPNSYVLAEMPFKKHLNTIKFLNTVDSLGHVRKLTLLDTTFEDALYDNCFKSKFDLIFVNAKNYDDICGKTLEKYFVLLNNYGFLCIQTNTELLTEHTRNTLEHYFTSISEKFKTTTLSSLHTFLVFRKMTNLI